MRVFLLCVLILAGCSSPSAVEITYPPTWTPVTTRGVAPTITPRPPTATLSPTETPSSTSTEPPSATPTETLAPPTAAPKPVTLTLYTNARANVRACASTSCQIVAGVEAGQAFEIIGEETGDRVAGSTLWYVADYNGQQVYVHSSLMSATTVRPASGTGSSSTGASSSGGAAAQPQPTRPPAPAPTAVPAGPNYTCNCSKTCEQMASCEEAYFQLNTCGCRRRDHDGDGVPCESICPGG